MAGVGHGYRGGIRTQRRAPLFGVRTKPEAIGRRRWPVRRDILIRLCAVLTIASFVAVNTILWRSDVLDLSSLNSPLPSGGAAAGDDLADGLARHRRGQSAGPFPEEMQRISHADIHEAASTQTNTPETRQATEDQKAKEGPTAITGVKCGEGDQLLTCSVDEIAVHAVAGSKERDPLICVNGKTVSFEESTDDGVVVVTMETPHWKQRTRIFDIASSGSASGDLVEHLSSLPRDTMILVTAFGVSARMFSQKAQDALYKLGSGHIHRLDSTHSWVLVTTNAMTISSPHEQLKLTSHSAAKISGCVAKNLYLSATTTAQRKAFCHMVMSESEPERYRQFCSFNEVSKYLLPSGVRNPGGTDATTKPVAILARHDRGDYLQQCLHSFFANPGLNLTYLTVYVDGYSEEVHMLVNLYGVRARFFDKTVTTSSMKAVHKRADLIAGHYARVIPLAFSSYPKASNMILIEEDHVVSPDFLYYFGQLVPVVHDDMSIMAVSAYNDNGFPDAAQDNGLVYRTEFFPGRAWMLPRRMWKEWAPNFPRCCSGWSWDLWIREAAQRKGRETLMPDVPRVHHIGKRGLQVNDYYWELYFKPTILNKDARAMIRDVNLLRKDLYEDHLNKLIQSALRIDTHGKSCGSDLVPETFGSRYVLYFHQSKDGDMVELEKLCKCFKLWDLGVRGVHKGVFRFHCKFNHILLVGSKSRYAGRYMPSDTVPYRAPS